MYKNHEADEMMVQLKGTMERGVLDESREVARALSTGKISYPFLESNTEMEITGSWESSDKALVRI